MSVLPRDRDPQESAAHGGYPREAVLKAERWAWAGEVVEGHAEFSFDGIAFWRRDRAGALHVAAHLEVPARGWWHRPTCNCPLCRARAVSAPTPREALESA